MSGRAWTALLWLDWKLLVNRTRTIRRNPRRLIPWVLFLAWLVPSWASRVLAGGHITSSLPVRAIGHFLEPAAGLVPGTALALFGLVVWRSDRAPAAFQSPADARFVVGAGLDARAVFAWLSLRTARRLIVSAAVVLVMAQLLYLSWLGVSGPRTLMVTLTLAAYGWLIFGTGMMAFNLRRTLPWLPVGGLGVLLTAGGAAAALAMLAQVLGIVTLPARIDVLIRAVPPGGWMLAAFGGDVVAAAVLVVMALAVTVTGIALAGDCYPELWETSSRIFALRAAVRARGGLLAFDGRRSRAMHGAPGAARGPARSSSGGWFPGGSWTVFWKEWVAMRRGRGGLLLRVLLLVVAAAIGVAVGVSTERGSTTGVIVSSNVALLLILWSWVASIRLGRDLGSPLWWLSSAPLWRRLTNWTLARALRVALPLIVFVEVAIAASGQELWLLAVAPWPPLLMCWLMQAVGLGGYALLPARTDYRLALMVRMLIVYAIAMPLALAWVPGALLHSMVLMAALPMGIAVGAGAGLIAFATWRIGGNGLAFAREERH